MKFFHTADWHLGKLVQGVYMTEDQRYILDQFIEVIKEEQPDAVVIAGDLYDRAVPPTEAVQLLDEVLEKIVIELQTPVLAIAGNHDSPSRLNFASKIMQQHQLHLVGQLSQNMDPVILHDEHGPVHFHLIPYCDPSVVRTIFEDDEIRNHHEATQKIIEQLPLDSSARHVYVGHAFVTPYGEEQDNTSESERPLSIGGAEYVSAELFTNFHYTALGHLHRAHYVSSENIRYAGSLLKYSMSEEHHQKGFYIVELDERGQATTEKRTLTPRRDLRTIEATMDELLLHPVSEDYVFVRLMDETPVLSPMEKIRSVYPNAMHVERKHFTPTMPLQEVADRSQMTDLDLFKSFYKQVKGTDATEETEALFKEVLDDLLRDENETSATTKEKEVVTQ